MEVKNKEIAEMLDVLAKQIASCAKTSYVEYNSTFISVIQRVRSKNIYDIIDEYNVVRTVPISIPNILLSVGQRVYVTIPNGDFTKMFISGIYLQTNRGEANTGSSTITPSQIGTYSSTQINNLLAEKAPNYHANASTTYGLGTGSLYGHVKVINNLNQESFSDGYALSAYQGKVLKSEIDTEITNRQNSLANLDYSSPSSSGSDISFIDTVSQTDGQISATKKSVRLASSEQTGVSKPDDTTLQVDSNGIMSIKSIVDRTTRLSLDFADDVDIITSNNAVNGFDSSPILYRRKVSLLWNYIKSKISLLCGKIKIATSESYEAGSVNPILSATFYGEDAETLYSANYILSIIGTDGANGNHPSVFLGSTGTTYVSSGQGGINLPSEIEKYDDENLYFSSSDYIQIYTGVSSDASTYCEPITIKDNSIGGANCNYYGTCDTAEDVSEKEIVLTDENFKLVIGAMIGVMFSETNIASGISLNVNNIGAISIYQNGALVTSGDGGCIADNVSFYMFNGTYWCKV